MKDNTSITITDPTAAVSFLDAHKKAWFPKKKYSLEVIHCAELELQEIKHQHGCGVALRMAELRGIINSEEEYQHKVNLFNNY